MTSLKTLISVYLIGGVTFIPLVILAILVYAYYTLPISSQQSDRKASSPLERDGDQKIILKSGTDDLAEKFLRKHEADVAAGYYAVCREYVPGGVNGKPPEIKTPGGEVIASESPSIYQSMYKSIFDRVQKPTIDPNKDTGILVRRANNVFYVVLRHGHLMLYDDIQQIEVRYVISLEYHDVDLYGGGEPIPESELWIKRNAIRLKRKQGQIGDKNTSWPFFLFSENCSEKEDFYFALLKNLQSGLLSTAPTGQEFDQNHIISLVQGLHSSEEQLQTRWLNALVGRLFLALYKTPELEAHIRQKLTKKMSRVKKPDFITKLALQKIDMGTAGPFITNPRLKDLTVNGDCTVEADVAYNGGFRIEIAATVRIDLGKRLGAREVDIVLAVTLKKLQGHVLVRLKPPPSNRLWVAFEKVPKVEMKLEPIVSTRSITLGVILRAIESRVLEVISETLVLPFWDDMPFTHTENEIFRGGIWKKDIQPEQSTEITDETVQEASSGTGTNTPDLISKDERVMSTPVLAETAALKAAAKKSYSSLKETGASEEGMKTPERQRQVPPRMMRSSSFAASAADPMVSPSHAPAESSPMDIKATSKRDSMLKDISARSLGTSPEDESHIHSKEAQDLSSKDRARTDSMASEFSTGSSSMQRRGTAGTEDSTDSKRSVASNLDSRSSVANAAKNLAHTDAAKTIASIQAAREAAQKWGWGVLARNKQQAGHARSSDQSTVDTSQPMGRGQPLPPPGQPLPKPPAKPSMFSLPVKALKSVPPAWHGKDGSDGSSNATPQESPTKQAPILPERNRRQSYMQSTDEHQDELLVVAAPQESNPATPLPADDEHHDEFFGHSENIQMPKPTLQNHTQETTKKYAPPLPNRMSSDERQAPPLPNRAASDDRKLPDRVASEERQVPALPSRTPFAEREGRET